MRVDTAHQYIPRFLARSIASSKVFRSVMVPSKASFMTLNCDSNSLRRPSTSQPVKEVTFESLVRKNNFVGEQDLGGEKSFLEGLLSNVLIVSHAVMNLLIGGGVVGAGAGVP